MRSAGRASRSRTVADYVLSLSGAGARRGGGRSRQEIFEEQCAACHGENGEGHPEQGAPNLTDADLALRQRRAPRSSSPDRAAQAGVMPGWIDRLDDATIKMLAVYVHSLGGGQ